MAGITEKTISMLWGLAAGRCSMCNEEIVERDVKIGEMAHVIGKKKLAARGEYPVEGDINGYHNLILLCPNDHTRVDKIKRLSPELLHQYKNQHEARVRAALDQNQRRVMDIGGLRVLMRFLPFTQLPAITNNLPERFDHKLHYMVEAFENFKYDNPQCAPFSDRELDAHYSSFKRCINNLVGYEQEAVIGMKNVYLPGAQIGLDSNQSYFNRELSSDERRMASAQVHALLNELGGAYYSFMDYLRRIYPEVNLASFEGW